MQKIILILTLTISSLAFSAETKKVIVHAKDHLTSADSSLRLMIGKKVTADCNGPYMIIKDHVSSYDVLEGMTKIYADYYLRKTAKYCEGDVPAEAMVYAAASKRTFSHLDEKIEITVPKDVDVFVQVTEIVKLEKVQ